MKQRVTTILKLGTPITIAMLSQSILNLVDAALVGPLGQDALAAVGVGSYANFVALASISGVSAAVQAQVARRYGAGNKLNCATPVNHGILLALIMTLPFSILLMLLAPYLIDVFNTTAEVHQAAVVYFRIRVMSLTAAAMCLSFRGYWNGTGSPSGFMKILIGSHIFNAAASYCLIYGVGGLPVMGVAGAALGTFLSMYLAALINLLVLLKSARQHGLMNFSFIRKRKFAQTKRLFELAVPNSFQQIIFSLGMMIFFAIIAQMGTSELAVTHVLMNISLLMILPGMGLGIAANTLVSQSLGAGDRNQAWRWGWDIVLVAMGLLLILSLPLIMVPEVILSLFLHDSALITLGVVPLQLTGLSISLDAASLVLTQALLGAGANRTVLAIRLSSQWLILLPLSYLAGPFLGLSLTAIWLVQAFQRLLSSFTFALVWQLRRWDRISV